MKDDPRIDPRIKLFFGSVPTLAFGDVASRQQALDETNTPEAIAQQQERAALFEMVDNEQVARSGLEVLRQPVR